MKQSLLPVLMFVIIAFAAGWLLGEASVNDETDYDLAYEDQVIQECLSGGGSQAACRCSLDQLQSLYTAEEARVLGRLGYAPPDLTAAVQANCSELN